MDEKSLTTGTKIFKEVSQSAALKVLHNHCKTMKKSKNPAIVKPPGRPQPHKKHENENEIKLKKFEILLEGIPNVTDICKLSWSGVPWKIRGLVWRLMSSYMPVNPKRRQNILERKRKDYWNFVRKYYTCEKDKYFEITYHQIHIDVPRTNPTIKLFQKKSVQLSLERILFVWSIMHPASGYVQGLNDLVVPFYLVFLQEIRMNDFIENICIDSISEKQLANVEADTFWCYAKFLEDIQDNYVFAQLGIERKINHMRQLVRRIDSTLHFHLLLNHVDYIQFSFRWMNNLLSREIPLRCIIRLWDTYISGSASLSQFLPYVCTAFLLHWRNDILQLKDFQDILLFLQNLPTQDWTTEKIDVLVAEAYKLKFTFADAPNHLRNSCDDSYFRK